MCLYIYMLFFLSDGGRGKIVHATMGHGESKGGLSSNVCVCNGVYVSV